jgi:hypothetical protein
MRDGEFPLLLKPYTVDSLASAVGVALAAGVAPAAATPVSVSCSQPDPSRSGSPDMAEGLWREAGERQLPVGV